MEVLGLALEACTVVGTGEVMEEENRERREEEKRWGNGERELKKMMMGPKSLREP